MPSPKALASASSSPVTAGAFQDPIGNVLANGKIALDLSQAALITGGGEIAPRRVSITLDVNGKVSAGQVLWANDQLTPSGTTYEMTVYDSAGNFAADFGSQSIVGGAPIDIALLTPSTINGGVITIPSATRSITINIDGDTGTPNLGVRVRWSVPVNCSIAGWVLVADASGSAVIDVLRSTYAAFPTTSSIAGTDKPTLASVQKNENLGPLTLWGSTSLRAGDVIEFNLSSVATCKILSLTLNITVP